MLKLSFIQYIGPTTMKWLDSRGAPMKTYQSQWQQQQRAEISSQPDVNKETTSKFAQNIKQSASAAASVSAFKTPVAMSRAQKLTEESRRDITNSHFAY